MYGRGNLKGKGVGQLTGTRSSDVAMSLGSVIRWYVLRLKPGSLRGVAHTPTRYGIMMD